jgi:hypothetical protein
MSAVDLVLGAVLLAGGAGVAAAGVIRQRAGLRRPVTDPAMGVALIRVLRSAVAGLGLAGLGIGWLWNLPPVAGLLLVIAGEELLETSVVLAATQKPIAQPSLRASDPPQ